MEIEVEEKKISHLAITRFKYGSSKRHYVSVMILA